ncbi:MAG: SdpI family protein [Bacteroidia bacterium]
MELLIANSIISLVFLLGGVITLIFPPKKINSLYGYRTSRSMKSIEAWVVANRFSSKVMIVGGIDLFLIWLII